MSSSAKPERNSGEIPGSETAPKKVKEDEKADGGLKESELKNMNLLKSNAKNNAKSSKSSDPKNSPKNSDSSDAGYPSDARSDVSSLGGSDRDLDELPTDSDSVNTAKSVKSVESVAKDGDDKGGILLLTDGDYY
jgi:hypothetical protein